MFRPVVWFVPSLLTAYVSPSKHILRFHSLPLMFADDMSTKVGNMCVAVYFSVNLRNEKEFILILFLLVFLLVYL